METSNIVTFNKSTPQEISWEVFVAYEPGNLYVAQSHCLTRIQPCWIVNGYTTESLALADMNNHIVTYIRNIPNATFEVICHPEETNQVVLNVTCLAKTWDVQVVSGTATPQNGTGKNYNETVLNCWNKIRTY